MKTCIKCNESKPLDEFSKMRSHYKGTCKACVKVYSQQWRDKKIGSVEGVFNVDKEMNYLIDQTPNNIYSGVCILKRDRIDHVNTFSKTA